jgi:hypothetical protein
MASKSFGNNAINIVNGNIGIGNINPTSQLVVSGDVEVLGTYNSGSIIETGPYAILSESTQNGFKAWLQRITYDAKNTWWNSAIKTTPASILINTPNYTYNGTGILDNAGVYTNAIAAYSLRRLFQNYEGPQIRIVRSDTANEAFDVWFDNQSNAIRLVRMYNNVLEYIVFTPSYTITTWAGSATLYIIKLYDQSGNNKNADGIGTSDSVRPILLLTSLPYSIYLNGSSPTVGGYFDMGSTTWNVATNGFTSFTFVNLKSANAWERLYDFNSGAGIDNMNIYRENTNNTIGFQILSGNVEKYKLQIPYINNTWITTITSYVKVDSTSWKHTLRNNKIAFTDSAIFQGLTNRTTTNTSIGRPPSTESYANMEFREMIFFDRSVTDSPTITGWENSIVFGALDSLSVYDTAVGAYALKLLFFTYTGPCVRVRRSDNVEANVWFDAYGVVTQITTDTQTFVQPNSNLDTWASGSALYVRTWYDQSAGGKHLQQTTTSAQPQLVQNLSLGGFVARYVTGSMGAPNLFPTTSTPTIHLLARLTTVSGGHGFNFKSDTTPVGRVSMFTYQGSYYWDAGNDNTRRLTRPVVNNVPSEFSITYTTTSSSLRVGESSVISNQSVPNAATDTFATSGSGESLIRFIFVSSTVHTSDSQTSIFSAML